MTQSDPKMSSFGHPFQRERQKDSWLQLKYLMNTFNFDFSNPLCILETLRKGWQGGNLFDSLEYKPCIQLVLKLMSSEFIS